MEVVMSEFSIEKTLSNAVNYQNKGNYESAVKCYDAVLSVDGSNLTAMNNLSVLYINSGNLEKAEILLLKIVNYNDVLSYHDNFKTLNTELFIEPEITEYYTKKMKKLG